MRKQNANLICLGLVSLIIGFINAAEVQEKVKTCDEAIAGYDQRIREVAAQKTSKNKDKSDSVKKNLDDAKSRRDDKLYICVSDLANFAKEYSKKSIDEVSSESEQKQRAATAKAATEQAMKYCEMMDSNSEYKKLAEVKVKDAQQKVDEARQNIEKIASFKSTVKTEETEAKRVVESFERTEVLLKNAKEIVSRKNVDGAQKAITDAVNMIKEANANAESIVNKVNDAFENRGVMKTDTETELLDPYIKAIMEMQEKASHIKYEWEQVVDEAISAFTDMSPGPPQEALKAKLKAFHESKLWFCQDREKTACADPDRVTDCMRAIGSVLEEKMTIQFIRASMVSMAAETNGKSEKKSKNSKKMKNGSR